MSTPPARYLLGEVITSLNLLELSRQLVEEFGFRLGEGLSEPSFLRALQFGEYGLGSEWDVNVGLGTDGLQMFTK